MELEPVGGVKNRWRVTLKKACPHCQQPTQHETTVLIPVDLNPSYKISCPSCGLWIWVNWFTNNEGEIMAIFY